MLLEIENCSVDTVRYNLVLCKFDVYGVLESDGLLHL